MVLTQTQLLFCYLSACLEPETHALQDPCMKMKVICRLCKVSRKRYKKSLACACTLEEVMPGFKIIDALQLVCHVKMKSDVLSKYALISYYITTDIIHEYILRSVGDIY